MQVISSKIVKQIEHRTVENISTATIIHASMVWHDEMLHHEQYTGESSAMFLPMIKLDLSDPSCIDLTRMQFVSYQAKQYDATIILTFDQPLYWKALTSIQSQTGGSGLKRMVLRLRRFHMQMSFFCSIGHAMAGSGLQKLLEVVFAGNAIRHNVDWQNYIQSSSWPHVDICCIDHHLCSYGDNITLPTKDTDDPKRDTASTDSERDDEETRSTGQQQGTVDVTSDITGAK